MRCRPLVIITTLVTAPDGRGHICYSNKKCSGKQHPLTRNPRESHPIPWHLEHPIERLHNQDFQNLKTHPRHPRHPRHVFPSRLQPSTPTIPIPPHLRTRLIRSPHITVCRCSRFGISASETYQLLRTTSTHQGLFTTYGRSRKR
jgi:hypothetical protein